MVVLAGSSVAAELLEQQNLSDNMPRNFECLML